MTSDSGAGLILLSLASRQIWPHILTVTHLKPSRLILLHSDDRDESKGPAQSLKKFFDARSQVISRGSTQLERIAHDDFSAVERRLEEIRERFNIPAGNCALNFTGGNKLMATAAFQWAAAHGVRSFYLERGNRLTWFEPSDQGLETRSEIVHGRIANSLDPVALLRCQESTSEVEREGETLWLSESGKALSEEAFQVRVRNGAIDGLLTKSGHGDREHKTGDALELTSAAALLKLGVHSVRRSLRLKVNTPSGVSSRRPHAEIDLLFNWNGRLWLVDCKDRVLEEELVQRLRRALPKRLSENAEELLRRIDDEMRISPTKVLKEDRVAISDIGGLLGQVVCVRRHPLPDEANAYARRNRIKVIQKAEIFEGFRRLLHPERPAAPDQLAALEKRYTQR